jgi:acetyl-CoA carboxylase biotin carboxyl carrier protein
VADDASKTPNPFDVRTVKLLAALMSQHDLSEIDLRQGEQRLLLRRGVVPKGVGPVSVAPAPLPAVEAPRIVEAAPAKPQAGDSAKPTHVIKAPTIGTFYNRPSPDAEPFVKVGSRVNNDTVVCIIEAMKLFNEITADCSGVITEILAENQQPVEYGQPLFKVDPSR